MLQYLYITQINQLKLLTKSNVLLMLGLPLELKVHLEEVLDVNLAGVIYYVPGEGVKEYITGLTLACACT